MGEGYSWKDFYDETSGFPRNQKGKVDVTATILDALIPQRQIIRLLIAVFHLIAAKARNRSRWFYITSQSLSATAGEVASAGVFYGTFTLERQNAGKPERIMLDFHRLPARVGGIEGGAGLSLLPFTVAFSTENFSSGGALLLRDPQADFEPNDFSSLSVALILDGGAGAGAYVGALLLGVSKALADRFVALRADLEQRRWLRALIDLGWLLEKLATEPFRGAMLFTGNEVIFNVGVNITIMVGVPTVQQLSTPEGLGSD